MIVYPPDNHETESSSIFFIGSAKDQCLINGQKIELYPNGNFSPVFDLKLGVNEFEIVIDGELLVRKIIRLDIQSSGLRAEGSGERNPEPRAPSPEQQILRICLDPGHGGSQRGTCSPKGIAEKDLNLLLAKKIKTKLLESGFDVIMTRDSDRDLALAERVTVCKTNNCNLFISVHHNAIPDHQNPLEHRGISVHYYYDHSKEIGKVFLENLVQETGLANAGLLWQDLHVLRENPETICLLIEFGYLIHPLESEIIVGEEFQEKAAESVVSSIQKISCDGL